MAGSQKDQQPQKAQNKQPNPDAQIEGEGSYSAARDYKQSIDQFMQENADNIDEMARDGQTTRPRERPERGIDPSRREPRLGRVPERRHLARHAHSDGAPRCTLRS